MWGGDNENAVCLKFEMWGEKLKNKSCHVFVSFALVEAFAILLSTDEGEE